MPAEEYHKAEALSKGKMDKLEKSPAHLKAETQNVSDAMILGSAFHAITLEPDKFNQEYRILEEGKTKTSKLKQQAEDDKVELLSFKDFVTIKNMADAVKVHPIASKLFNHGDPEQSFFWEHPQYGFLCKCRPDWINLKNDIIIDLKSITEADNETVRKQIANFNYHRQEYHYRSGIDIVTEINHKFLFVFVEKKDPYGINVVQLDDETKMAAQDDCEKLYTQYADCLEAGSWPSYEPVVKTLGLPQWKYYSIYN